MAYIGKGLVGVLSENKAVDTMSNPNGVLTTMTLSRTPGSVNNIEVYIDGVFQTPGDEFTLAGDVLTFTTAPATNAVVIAVVGNDSTIANVDNNSITGTMFPDGSVTDSKITDIVSTKISGTLPALDGSSLTNLTTGNLEGTLPALDGSPLTGVQGFRKNASDPLVNSNGNQGDVWVNTASGEVYVLTDATTNANVWTNVGDGTGNVTPSWSATGGSITTNGDYKVHSFTTSGSFSFNVTTVGATPTVEYLVIAGGAAGGGRNGTGKGGGGGAGGYRTATGFSVSAQQYTVVVGAGGSGVTAGFGTDGSNSEFSTITSNGGGGGGYYNGFDGRPGGSGGGGGDTDGLGGAGTSGQGFSGGAVSSGGGGSAGGGGGGAGAAGADNPSAATGGAGGAGLASDILVTGQNVLRAGGGGGAGSLATTGGAVGGTGGGGRGQTRFDNDAGTGTVNSGSGGGGTGESSGTSGSGGSGIVILRYKFK